LAALITGIVVGLLLGFFGQQIFFSMFPPPSDSDAPIELQNSTLIIRFADDMTVTDGTDTYNSTEFYALLNGSAIYASYGNFIEPQVFNDIFEQLTLDPATTFNQMRDRLVNLTHDSRDTQFYTMFTPETCVNIMAYGTWPHMHYSNHLGIGAFGMELSPMSSFEEVINEIEMSWTSPFITDCVFILLDVNGTQFIASFQVFLNFNVIFDGTYPPHPDVGMVSDADIMDYLGGFITHRRDAMVRSGRTLEIEITELNLEVGVQQSTFELNGVEYQIYGAVNTF